MSVTCVGVGWFIGKDSHSTWSFALLVGFIHGVSRANSLFLLLLSNIWWETLYFIFWLSLPKPCQIFFVLWQELGVWNPDFFFFLFSFLVFWGTVSLCSFGCPETRSVHQAGLNSQRSACCYLLGAEIKVMCHHHLGSWQLLYFLGEAFRSQQQSLWLFSPL